MINYLGSHKKNYVFSGPTTKRLAKSFFSRFDSIFGQQKFFSTKILGIFFLSKSVFGCFKTKKTNKIKFR